MAATVSAGLLMCKIENHKLFYFLVHPGGPFYKNKELAVWSIPKGIPEKNEDLLLAAQREFFEESGIKPVGPFHSLEAVQQKAGKIVHAWAFEGNWNSQQGIRSNTFTLEWPPKSGKFQDYPEQDKAEWMPYEKAVRHINPAQIPFLDRAKLIFQIF